MAVALVAGCSVAPRGPSNRPDLPDTEAQADPRLVAAIQGAANDGPAVPDLTRAVAEARGFERLGSEEARAAAAGSVWRTEWRSGRITEALDHRASGLRLERLAFESGFANGVTTAWYIDENGFYCETDASRRNCGPLYGNADGSELIWFNRSEPTGPFGTLYRRGPGPASVQGPIGPLSPAPRVTVSIDPGAGGAQTQAEGEAVIFRMVTRDEPGELSAAFSVPSPIGDGRCVALRHPSREAELICPGGIAAQSPTVGSGWPDEPAVLSLQSEDGTIVTLSVGPEPTPTAADGAPSAEAEPSPAQPTVPVTGATARPIDLSL